MSAGLCPTCDQPEHPGTCDQATAARNTQLGDWDEMADAVALATRPPWHSDHRNLAMVARFMHQQDHTTEEIIYMLERPDKHGDDYNLAQAESELT